MLEFVFLFTAGVLICSPVLVFSVGFRPSPSQRLPFAVVEGRCCSSISPHRRFPAGVFIPGLQRQELASEFGSCSSCRRLIWFSAGLIFFNAPISS
jgi:hypothetical protein